jgi:hypothetical protein
LATSEKLTVLALAEYKVYLHFQAIWTGFNPSLFITIPIFISSRGAEGQGSKGEQGE